MCVQPPCLFLGKAGIVNTVRRSGSYCPGYACPCHGTVGLVARGSFYPAAPHTLCGVSGWYFCSTKLAKPPHTALQTRATVALTKGWRGGRRGIAPACGSCPIRVRSGEKSEEKAGLMNGLGAIHRCHRGGKDRQSKTESARLEYQARRRGKRAPSQMATS